MSEDTADICIYKGQASLSMYYKKSENCPTFSQKPIQDLKLNFPKTVYLKKNRSIRVAYWSLINEPFFLLSDDKSTVKLGYNELGHNKLIFMVKLVLLLPLTNPVSLYVQKYSMQRKARYSEFLGKKMNDEKVWSVNLYFILLITSSNLKECITILQKADIRTERDGIWNQPIWPMCR